MSDVFIIGAGFSRAVSADMPLLVDLSRELEKRIEGLQTVSGLFPDNVEMWLTYLSQAHPWLSEAENLRNRAVFLDLSLAIREILANRIRETVRRDCPGWFLDLAQWWHANKAVVLSLNYDTLIEKCIPSIPHKNGQHTKLHSWDVYPVPLTQAYERIGTGYIYRPSTETFRLFKLHGSINWFYSGRSPSHGETLYFLPHADGWKEEYEFLEKLMTDKIPLIVPPLADKLPYFEHETLRALWFQAASALRSASRVFYCGYSLPITDITMRFFLGGNCPTNPVPFHIADTSADRVNHLLSLLPRNYTMGRAFTGCDAIPSLTRALLAGDLGNP